MKDNDIHDLIDRLQGFDSEELEQEMTDGLEEWCQRRRQHARNVKRVVLIALLLLTTTAIAMTAIPWLHAVLHNAQSDAPATAASSAPKPSASRPPETAECAAGNAVAQPARPQPVDYYYTGVSENGYSIAYGHETRTVTYTRYSGSHIISSVVHNALESLFIDTATVEDSAAAVVSPEVDSMSQAAVRSMIQSDFQTVELNGDVLYFTIIDSVSHHVSVRADVAQWMGQTIRYGDTLVVPAHVAYQGVSYTVTTLADSAFARHAELRAVVLPATVSYIGHAALAHCSNLVSLTLLAPEAPEVSPTAFNRTDPYALLLVPCGSLEVYEESIDWLYFRRREERCP